MTKEEALIRVLEYASGTIRGVAVNLTDEEIAVLEDVQDSIETVIDALDEMKNKAQTE